MTLSEACAVERVAISSNTQVVLMTRNPNASKAHQKTMAIPQIHLSDRKTVGYNSELVVLQLLSSPHCTSSVWACQQIEYPNLISVDSWTHSIFAWDLWYIRILHTSCLSAMPRASAELEKSGVLIVPCEGSVHVSSSQILTAEVKQAIAIRNRTRPRLHHKTRVSQRGLRQFAQHIAQFCIAPVQSWSAPRCSSGFSHLFGSHMPESIETCSTRDFEFILCLSCSPSTLIGQPAVRAPQVLSAMATWCSLTIAYDWSK